jgi:hypothetical protein
MTAYLRNCASKRFHDLNMYMESVTFDNALRIPQLEKGKEQKNMKS